MPACPVEVAAAGPRPAYVGLTSRTSRLAVTIRGATYDHAPAFFDWQFREKTPVMCREHRGVAYEQTRYVI